MKKLNLDPLALDKKTIACLDEKQLQEIIGGGVITEAGHTSTGCGSGGSTCSANSTGCVTGGSSC